MRIEEAAARTQARHRLRRPGGDRRQHLPARRRGPARRAQGRQRRRLPPADRQARAAARRARRRRGTARPRRADRVGRGRRRHGSLDGNLLALAVDAARAKATVGEISDALEKVWGRHQAMIRTISGVFRDEAGAAGDALVQQVLAATAEFEEAEGRRPAHPGRQDGPGRPRPRPEGHRQRVRRHGLRRRRRARCSPRRRRSPSRRSTPTCTSSGSARWPPAT